MIRGLLGHRFGWFFAFQWVVMLNAIELIAQHVINYVVIGITNVMIVHGMPEHIRSDNGPEFIANRLRDWLAHVGVNTAYMEPGSPWENGYCESFNGTLRNELLDGEIFYGIKEVQALVY